MNSLPDTCANLNIPIKDGVFSLRPERLASDCSDILENIDPGTVDQLKMLNTNINKIVSLAEQRKAAPTAPKTGTKKKTANKKGK